MFELKIRRVGKSLGVVLPKEVLHRIGCGEGDRLLLIEADGPSCCLAHHDGGLKEKMKKVEQIIKRYRSSLRALAKS